MTRVMIGGLPGKNEKLAVGRTGFLINKSLNQNRSDMK